MVTSYLTIARESKGLFKDRNSKFYAYAYPVTSENAIKTILEQLRKEYHDARHHCYAWKLGTEPANTRANDDGEPASSAGKPILNQIEKHELTDVLVVVIRYFGGTLLGVGGLINAYRSAAGYCLENAKVIRKNVQEKYKVHFKYPDMNAIMKVIKEYDLETYDQSFDMACSLKIKVNINLKSVVEKKLSTIESCSYEQIIE
ncbi:IMPACT family protein [Bacteroidota bacterium]